MSEVSLQHKIICRYRTLRPVFSLSNAELYVVFTVFSLFICPFTARIKRMYMSQRFDDLLRSSIILVFPSSTAVRKFQWEPISGALDRLHRWGKVCYFRHNSSLSLCTSYAHTVCYSDQIWQDKTSGERCVSRESSTLPSQGSVPLESP